MPAPPPTPTIDALLAALDLAPRFALVLVVGPESHPQLALSSLQERLEIAGQEVFWHSLADGELDVSFVLRLARSANPVVMLSGAEELSEDMRRERFTRMNLQRDVWGQHALRVVMWCAPDQLDLFRRAAPDLFHWRSLLQVLEPVDLPVFGPRTYLAWTADACRERSDDRVWRGGLAALRDPLLVELDPGAKAATRFSTWIDAHPRSIVVRQPTVDPRYPAKGLAHELALRRLQNDRGAPYPILLRTGELDALFAMRLSLGPVPFLGEGWDLLERDDILVLLIDDGSAIDPGWSARIDALGRGSWIVVTDRQDAWDWPWPRAVALAVADPLTVQRESIDAVRALGELLLDLFEGPTLVRFVALAFGEELADRLPRTANRAIVADAAVSLLLREGRVDSELFAQLEGFRPRRWRDIRVVRDRFAELAEPGR